MLNNAFFPEFEGDDIGIPLPEGQYDLGEASGIEAGVHHD